MNAPSGCVCARFGEDPERVHAIMERCPFVVFETRDLDPKFWIESPEGEEK